MGFFFSMFMMAVSMIMQHAAASAARKRQRKMEKQAKERADAAKGFTVPVEGEASVLAIQYGRGLLGGVRVAFTSESVLNVTAPVGDGVVFHNSLNANRVGTKHEFLILQVAICHAAINACYGVLVDGVTYTDPKFSSAVGNSDGLDKNRIMGGHRIHFYPSGNIVDTFATSNGLTAGTFTDVAYATCAFGLNRDEYQYQGVPDVRFMVEGMKVASIVGTAGQRRVSPTKSYSNNPALCLLDYLMNTNYGRGLSESYIDLDSFYNAYLVCERVVNPSVTLDGLFWATKGGTRSIKLYECNLALSPSSTIRDNIETLLETMGQAELVWSGGKYKLSLEYPQSYNPATPYSISDVVESGSGSAIQYYKSLIANNTTALTNTSAWDPNVLAATLTDDDIIRGAENSVSWPNASSRYNYATVRFLNEAVDFAEDSVSWPPRLGAITGPGIDRGAYSSTASYGKSDIVTYLGVKYQMSNGITYRGAWSASISYLVGDRVLSGATVYRCLVANTNVAVTTTSTWVAAAVTPITDSMWVVYDSSTIYNTYRAEDNGMPLEADFFESGITDFYHALAKCQQRVKTSRLSTVYKFSLITKYTYLEPGDFIKVNSNVLNIPGEIIRVEELKVNNKGNVEVTGSKFLASSLAWNIATTESITPPNIFDTNVAQCTNLNFSSINLMDNLSSGKFTWTAPSDIRVVEFEIKYTVTVPASVNGTTTVWISLGRTKNLYFDLPSMATADYTLTVVPITNTGLTSPRDNTLGSSWPLLGVGVNAVSASGTVAVPLTLYTRSATAPVAPTTGTFNFLTMTLSTVAGWSSLPPAGNTPLYATQCIATTTDVNTPDSTLGWSTPVLFSDTTISVDVTKSTLPIGQDFAGGSTVTSDAWGYVKIDASGTDLATTAEATYTVTSIINCIPVIDTASLGVPTAGMLAGTGTFRGRYSVSGLTGKQGSFVVNVFFRARTYSFTIFVLAVKDVYIKDTTPPPAPTNISVKVGLNTVFVTNDAPPAYTVGHGHGETRVYGAVTSAVGVLNNFGTVPANITASRAANGADLVATCNAAPTVSTGLITSVPLSSTSNTEWSVTGLTGSVGIATSSSAALTTALPRANVYAVSVGGSVFSGAISGTPITAFTLATIDVLRLVFNPIALTLDFYKNGTKIVSLAIPSGQVWYPFVAFTAVAQTATLKLPERPATAAAGTFASATIIGRFPGNAYSLARNVAEPLRLWFKYCTVDGYESADSYPPSAGAGLDATTLKLGPNDIAADSITADKLAVGSITADKLAVGAISVNTITLDNNGYLKGGQTAYGVGDGFYLGYDITGYKMSIGNTTQGFTWDGTNFAIKGGSMNFNNRLMVDSAGMFTLKSAITGARLEIINDVIRVYDAAGTLRVKLGNLA